MRLLFFGDLAPTGFGTVTMDLGRELLNLGHDLRFVSQNEIGDNLTEPFVSRTWTLDDPSAFVPELVSGESQFGPGGLGMSALALRSEGFAGFFNGKLWNDGWTPEAALILGDFGNVRLMVMRDATTREAFAMVPTFHYVPIEGVDIPPTLREMWSVVHPIAMTNSGADEIERLTGSRPPMIYHGVDSEVFHPVSPERMIVLNGKKLRSKADCKKAIAGHADGKWILRTDRNVPRKRYAEFFRSMAPVLLAHPDTTLVVHCNDFDQGGSLSDTLSKYHPALRKRIIVTDAGGRLDRTTLVTLYNAADVYATNSAEGFGLTIAEALACGVPAVGIDFSAVPEVIGPGGIVTPIASLIDNEYGYFWAAANQQALGDAVSGLLTDDIRRKALGRAGISHVRSAFSWAESARQFADAMTHLEAAA